MTIPDIALAEQRQALRGQMQLQRQRIALRLAPVDGAFAEFPRSMTMRLVMGRPLLLVKLAMGLLQLWRWRRHTRASGVGG